MGNPTTNFGWQMPTATDLVTDLPADFEVFGQAVDTDFVDLLGGTTGQVLSKTSGTDLAFTWIAQDATLTFNQQTGTTYTLVVGDAGKLVTTSNAGAITVTVPPSVFAAGDVINLQSIGVGLTTFAAGAGVTITSTGATAAAPIVRAQYSACSIVCTASNVFTILGDLS
jgi:hypothetical protein